MAMSSAERLTTGFHTQDESRDFVGDGFVVLEGFLDGRETAEIHALVESALHLPRDMACTRPHNTLLPLRWNSHIVQLLLLSLA
jgi:hypothetical protein